LRELIDSLEVCGFVVPEKLAKRQNGNIYHTVKNMPLWHTPIGPAEMRLLPDWHIAEFPIWNSLFEILVKNMVVH